MWHHHLLCELLYAVLKKFKTCLPVWGLTEEFVGSLITYYKVLPCICHSVHSSNSLVSYHCGEYNGNDSIQIIWLCIIMSGLQLNVATDIFRTVLHGGLKT